MELESNGNVPGLEVTLCRQFEEASMPDFGSLTVDTVIMHELPRGRAPSEDDHGVALSEAPIELGSTDKGFLETKLREGLGGFAREVVEDVEEQSPVPDMVRQLVRSTDDLVESSRVMAVRLRCMQAHVTPISLLLIASGKIQDENVIVISKLDHEQAMRVEQTTNAQGLRTYRAQHLRDLVLGQGTQVFKAGAFSSSAVPEDGPLSGHVVDTQRGQGGIADYFLLFLGCQFISEPRVLTQRFFELSQKVIRNSAKNDPETQAAYEIGLLAAMQSQSGTLSPERFAQDIMRPEHQDAFMSAVRESGLPVRQFRKDTELIANEIRRVKVQTARDATIFVPPSMYEDGSLKIETISATKSRVTIEDEVKSITGANGSKRLTAEAS